MTTKIELQNIQLEVSDEDADKLVAVFQNVLKCPAWMQRPNQPGLWLTQNVTNKPTMRYAAMTLDQADIDRGAPFGVDLVYGPVPLPPRWPQVNP